MSKSILVIDTPTRCEDCLCYTDELVSKYWNICRKLNIKVDTEANKPYWCPLKPTPSKMKVDYDYIASCEVTEKVVAMGWNACIDEILGEEK